VSVVSRRFIAIYDSGCQIW